MATAYYGDSIGDAARAEERALERQLNLGLANREFSARQQARRDAIAAQNAQNAMAADRLGLSLGASERMNRYNIGRDLEDRMLDREERDYGRKQDALELKISLEEADKQRQLQRELNELRSDNYIQRLQQTEDQRTYADIAKRIASDDIRDIPALQDVEGGRLGSDEWVDLKSRLGLRQQRLMEESALGPEAAALEATLALKSDPQFAVSESDPGQRRALIDRLNRDMSANRAYSGKILPDYTGSTFKPVRSWKYSGPRDAIDWYGGGTTPRSAPAVATPAPAVPAEPPPPGFWSRLGKSLRHPFEGYGPPTESYTPLGHSRSPLEERLGDVDPYPTTADWKALADETEASLLTDRLRRAGSNTIAPPPPPTTKDPLLRQKLAEIQALKDAGMDQDEAALVVANKYRNKPGGSFSVRTY